MGSDLRGIGRMARESGLTVSALRFYDGAGVLVPERVDPHTGYRWYGEGQVRDARLVAHLRRVGMPLADIRRVLAHHRDPAAVGPILDAHLRRLEDGLAAARRALSSVRTLVEPEDTVTPTDPTDPTASTDPTDPTASTASTDPTPSTGRTAPTRATVGGADLAAALGAVRFAVSTDPALPTLAGALVEIDGDRLVVVATDRYRLAVSEAPVRAAQGPAARAVLPTALVDDLLRLAAGTDTVDVVLDGNRFVAVAGDVEVAGATLDVDFPDHRRVVADRAAGDPHRVPVDVAALRASVDAGPVHRRRREQDGLAYDVTVLVVRPDGVAVGDGPAPDDGDAEVRVAVNREFLLEALAAGAEDQLVLELDGPIRPLALRSPARAGTFSLLMPTAPA